MDCEWSGVSLKCAISFCGKGGVVVRVRSGDEVDQYIAEAMVSACNYMLKSSMHSEVLIVTTTMFDNWFVAVRCCVAVIVVTAITNALFSIL